MNINFKKLFFISIVLVTIFWVIYFKVYVGEFVYYGKIRGIRERACPLIRNKSLCEKVGCNIVYFDLGTFCRADKTFSI